MFKVLISCLFILCINTVFSADWSVKMLNYGEKGGMIFEPDFVHAAVGDTVTFVPTNSGHNARSYIVPTGDTSWKTPVGESFTISLQTEGLHLYYCPPHLMMGMVGMIQVGQAKNLETVLTKSPKLRSKVVLKPQRVDDVLSQIIQ
ncbi:pseudoazurin [Marinomonas sp. 2405UD68-3]|uniref:pseudoazurin n=1 Tax=Marinomonas sp. 2405UD68-3 TaxID=3391835 RepID=UPI0039C92CCA